MYILVMACATVIVAQIAPPAGLDTSACPLNSFVPSLATLDDVCCAGGACEGGGLPKSCSVDCAIVFVPFRDRCRATIDLVYDGSAPQFAAVYDLCLAIDVRALMDRINSNSPRRSLQTSEVCLDPTHVAVAAMDSAYAVSNAFARFKDNEIPMLLHDATNFVANGHRARVLRRW